jgi:hypothetical protein
MRINYRGILQNCSHFRRIFLTVGSGIFNSWLALCTDFLGLQVKRSRTLSTISLVALGVLAQTLSLITDAVSVMKLFILPLDQCIRRTMTSKLRSKRALNCHKIPGHTDYAWSVRQSFPSNTGLCFSCEMAVVPIGPFQILCSLCVINTNFTIL